MTCQPKGSMCMGCSNGSAACGQRDFGSMPVIQVYPDGVKAVKCSGHLAAALHASDEALAAKRVDLAKQPEPTPLRCCISCGAAAHAELVEGEDLPCGA